MLTWISEQAKWIIYIFIVFIVFGLLFMDMSSLQTNRVPEVGSVNGIKISNEQFNAQLQRIQQQQSGQNLTSAQLAELRQNLFRSFVQQELMDVEKGNLQTISSVHEMMEDLRVDPPAGLRQSPQFMTDSVFDQNKYEAWLATDSIYDDPQLIQYEKMLKFEKIPGKQIQLYVNAGFHFTDVEAKYNVERRENKVRMAFISLPLDSVNVSDLKVSDEEIKAYFESHLDSFYVKEDLASVDYTALKIAPSSADEASALEYAELLLTQLKDGAEFADMARVNSDDPGSSQNGGSLGDYTSASQWVKPFSDAAFALDSGELSKPVRSQFGYHIILSHGKKVEDGEEKVKASHILLKVVAGTETVDSLRSVLQDLKAQVDSGAVITDVAKSMNLELKTSPLFARGAELPSIGRLSGLATFLFSTSKYREKTIASEVLMNENFLVVCVKKESLEAGNRSMDHFKKEITNAILKDKKAVLAQARLAEIMKTLPPVLDSSSLASLPIEYDSVMTGLDGYVPGLGYASNELVGVFAQKDSVWGAPVVGDRAVLAFQILGRFPAAEVALKQSIAQEKESNMRYGKQGLFAAWTQQLQDGAEVVNNLDIFFQE